MIHEFRLSFLPYIYCLSFIYEKQEDYHDSLDGGFWKWWVLEVFTRGLIGGLV